MWDEYMNTKKRAAADDDDDDDASGVGGSSEEQQQPEYHFEIGANIGACVMQILLTTPDFVQVVAFEPNPKNLFCLTTTLMRLPLKLRRRVILFPVALGAEMANSTIHMSIGNYGNSVVSKEIEVDNLKYLEPVPIQVEVMDDLIDSSEEQVFQVGVMKMDIQGYECYAMRGMHGLLAKTYQIKFETDNRLLGVFDSCSSDILFSQMRENGFGIYSDRAESTKPLLGNAPEGMADYFAMKKQESTSSTETCNCIYPDKWTAQAGQDKFLFERILEQQGLCCKGVFVEFGARNGIEHSNTYAFETYMGWKGLMFELDPREYGKLEQNRPGASIGLGAVCPSGLKEISVLLSTISGHSGALDQYEEQRLKNVREKTVVKCYNLAEELRMRGMHRVDYMTIDTEGSEVEIVLDFPWDDFDIRVVQIEQLVASKYPGQAGKKEKITEHMLSHGYELFQVYVVGRGDTDDLMFTRNLPLNDTSTSR
jgi:FkbM family methyltransferase